MSICSFRISGCLIAANIKRNIEARLRIHLQDGEKRHRLSDHLQHLHLIFLTFSLVYRRRKFPLKKKKQKRQLFCCNLTTRIEAKRWKAANHILVAEKTVEMTTEISELYDFKLIREIHY